MNPNSSDGLLTWGLPNSRWILNQLERKIPTKDVITRYRILIYIKKIVSPFEYKDNLNIFNFILITY